MHRIVPNLLFSSSPSGAPSASTVLRHTLVCTLWIQALYIHRHIKSLLPLTPNSSFTDSSKSLWLSLLSDSPVKARRGESSAAAKGSGGS